MRDSVILDSSVIAAIFFKEEASERAEEALRDYKLITVGIVRKSLKRAEEIWENLRGYFYEVSLSIED